MKSEKTVQIGGADYTLAFSFSAVVRAEAESGVSIFAMLEEDLSLQTLGILLWAVLQDHHQIDQAGAGELIEKAGAAPILAALSEGIATLLGGKVRAAPADGG